MPSEYNPTERLPPVKPKKAKPSVRPQTGTSYVPPPSKPLPSGPPARALADHGVHLGISEINTKVQGITLAHEKAFGTKPAPGLIFDILRGDDKLGGMSYDDLFSFPKSSRLARYAGMSRSMSGTEFVTDSMPRPFTEGNIDLEKLPVVWNKDGTYSTVRSITIEEMGKQVLIPTVINGKVVSNEAAIRHYHKTGKHLGVFESPQAAERAAEQIHIEQAAMHPDEEFLSGLRVSGTEGKLHEFIAENEDRFNEVMRDPKLRAKATNAYLKAQTAQTLSILPDPELVAQRGEEFARAVPHGALRTWQIATLAVFQLEAGLTAGPVVLGIQQGTAAYQSARQKSLRPLASAEKDIAVTVAKQTYNDWKAIVTGDTEYLAANPGNVGLSAFGTLAFGAGGVARFMAGLRAESFATGFLYPLRESGTKTMRRTSAEGGEMTAERLRFENPLVRVADDLLQDKREKRANLGKEPLGAAGLRRAGWDWGADLISKHFSYQAKMSRELLAQRAVDFMIDTYLANELEKIAGPSIQAAEAFSKVPRKVRKGLEAGEMKALHVLTMGGDWKEALLTMRGAHEFWRDAAVEAELPEIADAHGGQIGLLKLAQDVLGKWDVRSAAGGKETLFDKVVPVFFETLDEAERVKIDELGLAPETAEARRAMEYEIYKSREELPDRKATAQLIKNLESQVEGTPAAKRFADLQDGLGAVEADLMVARQAHRPTRELVARKKDLQDKLAEMTQGSFGQKLNQLEGLRATLATAERRIRNAERRPGARRAPNVPAYHSSGWQQFTESGDNFMRRGGRFGEGPPSLPSELTHSYTGRAIISGSIRVDMPTLAANDLVRAVHAVARMEDYDLKVKMAVKKRPTGPEQVFFFPIRTGPEVDKTFRGLLAKTGTPDLTEQELAGFSKTEIEQMNSILYPGVEEALKGEIKDLKWYDIRDFPAYKTPPDARTGWRKGFGKAYTYVGRPKIYMAPRYMLNTVSNKFMNALAEEPWMGPKTYTAAMHGKEIYGERVMHAISKGMGESRSHALAPLEDTGRLEHRMIQLTDIWHLITDRDDRNAAFFHYAWKKGFTSKDDINRLLFDKENRKAVREIFRRGNKSVVELNNLTWNEQHYLRHFIFVYPWRSRQFVWVLRTLAEHPSKLAILNAIGQDSQNELLDEAKPWMKNALEHYRRIGYMITGWDENGNPKVSSIGTLNTLSAVSDLMNFDASTSLGPGLEFAVKGLSSQDELGNRYAGNEPEQWFRAALDVVMGLPQVLAYQRGRKKQKDLPPIDWGDRATITHRLNAAADRIALSPGWLGGLGALISGALTPRTADQYKLWSRWYKGLEPEERHDYEMTLIRFVLGRQAKLMKREVPLEVKQAVELIGKVAWEEKLFEQEHGVSTLPALEKDYALVRVLAQEGLLSKQESDRQMKLAQGRGPDPKDHDRYRSNLIDRLGHGAALREWDIQIRHVASFREEIFNEKIKRLHAQGLAPQKLYAGKQDTLYELGRRVTVYEAELAKRKAAANLLSGAQQELAFADIRLWIQEQDKPVALEGRKYPSVVRLQYIDATEEQRAGQRRGLSARSWGTMSGFDKTILGRKTTEQTAAGWYTVKAWLAEQQARLPAGESLPDGTEEYYQDVVASRNPDFKKDLLFSRQIVAERLKVLRPIVDSKYRRNWDDLLDGVSAKVKSLYDKGWKVNDAAEQWARAYAPSNHEWLATQPKGFQAEVQAYIRDDPQFIESLGGR